MKTVYATVAALAFAGSAVADTINVPAGGDIQAATGCLTTSTNGPNSRRNVTHTRQTQRPNGIGTLTHEAATPPLSELNEVKFRKRGWWLHHFQTTKHREVRT